MIALLLALLWPAPCADEGTCWLTWDHAERVEWYEVWSGDKLCATIYGHYRRNGSFVLPRNVYQPYPGDGCWDSERQISYHIIACNEFGCGNWTDEIPFGPQDFMCFNHISQIPCEE